jgi:eukaryotic-like serine/threonine-protein kinase
VVPPVIGRFVLERRLGVGGFATVWLAHDPELDAPVAVKILADNWAEHADVRRRFADEARLLRRVDNDLVVRVYDVGTLPDGRPYLVMTYADGGSLADRMQEHPPPWSATAVLDLVDAVAAGLAALHGHGIVHRDIGPRNILFGRAGPDGRPRTLLGDLGIARDLRWASGLTQPAGTAGYRAPEQTVVSADVGPAADVHALAVTAADLLGLTGPPWPDTAVGEVLRRATEPDPQRRTPTPARLAAELRAVLGDVGAEPRLARTEPDTQRTPVAQRIPVKQRTPVQRRTRIEQRDPLDEAAPVDQPAPAEPHTGIEPNVPRTLVEHGHPPSWPPPDPPSSGPAPGAPDPWPQPVPVGSRRPSDPPDPRPEPARPEARSASGPLNLGRGSVPAGGRSASTPGRTWPTPPGGRSARRVPRALVAAIGTAAVLAALLIWGLGHRDLRVVSANGRVAVTLPGEWSTSAVLVPGETSGEGVHLVSGDRSVSAALAPVPVPAAQVAARPRVPGCATVQPHEVSAGDLRGSAFVYTGCAGSDVVSEAGLSDPADPGWVVWVEVRSSGGTPQLEEVLRGLEVQP